MWFLILDHYLVSTSKISCKNRVGDSSEQKNHPLLKHFWKARPPPKKWPSTHPSARLELPEDLASNLAKEVGEGFPACDFWNAGGFFGWWKYWKCRFASIEKNTEQKLKFHACMSFTTYFYRFSWRSLGDSLSHKSCTFHPARWRSRWWTWRTGFSHRHFICGNFAVWQGTPIRWKR